MESDHLASVISGARIAGVIGQHLPICQVFRLNEKLCIAFDHILLRLADLYGHDVAIAAFAYGGVSEGPALPVHVDTFGPMDKVVRTKNLNAVAAPQAVRLRSRPEDPDGTVFLICREKISASRKERGAFSALHVPYYAIDVFNRYLIVAAAHDFSPHQSPVSDKRRHFAVKAEW